MRVRARGLAEDGFGVIAGHHPHVVQPLELVDGAVCLYSGGNVVGPAIPLSWPCRLFVALEVALATEGPDPGAVIGYRVHPFVQLQQGGRPLVTTLAHLPPVRAGQFRRRLGLLFDLDVG
jgi:poly-gamma-glutamate synthesis protein (capsule biosynthesis protein)